jgi:hypothetical protein
MREGTRVPSPFFATFLVVRLLAIGVAAGAACAAEEHLRVPDAVRGQVAVLVLREPLAHAPECLVILRIERAGGGRTLWSAKGLSDGEPNLRTAGDFAGIPRAFLKM